MDSSSRTSASLRPMKRLMEKTVFCGLVTAWRLATVPTRRSPPLVNATTDGVVRPPSAFSMTVGSPPSSTAMQELVVPRSIPMVLPMFLGVSLLAPEKNLSHIVEDLSERCRWAGLGSCMPADGSRVGRAAGGYSNYMTIRSLASTTAIVAALSLTAVPAASASDASIRDGVKAAEGAVGPDADAWTQSVKAFSQNNDPAPVRAA